MAIPEVGATLVSPSGNEYVVCDRAADEGRIELRDPHGTKLGWLRWSEMVRWRVLDESEISAAQWPDADFEKARAVADELVKGAPYDHGTLGDFVAAVRAEQARRESQVCGATAPFTIRGHFPSCSQAPHPANVAHHDKSRDADWHDPPSCDRPHMTEVAERVFETARLVARANRSEYIPGLLSLRDAIRIYDREADHA